MRETPFHHICTMLAPRIPESHVSLLPRKWEKIGHVLVVKWDKNLDEYKEIICAAYATVLNVTTVLGEIQGIVGLLREPTVELLYGSPQTETIHVEQGIRYKLDPQKIMFSSGNMSERMRMASLKATDETIVDLFAGIGYFTLPLAMYAKPQTIIACELNPVAYDYLCKNIILNHVTERVRPLLGDNREVAPRNVAERVIMGYLGGTAEYLPLALDCLKQARGIIHFHDIYADERIPDEPLQHVQRIAREKKRTATLLEYHRVKSYAPGISHAVIDMRIA
jgi:tRNA wybutosine-synthesizing protein 2